MYAMYSYRDGRNIKKIKEFFMWNNKQTKKEKQVTYTCSDCGNKHSQGWPEDHICTWHEGKCDMCNKNAAVCHKRAWIEFKAY